MAYPRPRGDDPLNFEEYDPTPFSGGYDQVALYGPPKPTSSQTCYPISDSGPEGGSFGSHYGSENTPYLPGKGSGPKYGVDEGRASYKHQDPPHGSGDDFPSSYGRPTPTPKPKPKPSSGYDEGVGYGTPKLDPAYQEQTYGGDFGGGEEDEGYKAPGYGRPKPKPTNESSFADEEEFGVPKPGFGRPKPTYSAEGEEGYGRPTYGSGFGSEEGYGNSYERPPPAEEGYGGGRRTSRYEGEDSEFGVGDDDRFGGRKPSKYESEESGFGGGFGGRRPSEDRPDFGEDNEEGYGGRRPKYADRPSYGGSFGEDQPPPPPAEEEYGGYGKNTWEEGGRPHEGHGQKHHHKHHWRPDDE